MPASSLRLDRTRPHGRLLQASSGFLTVRWGLVP